MQVQLDTVRAQFHSAITTFKSDGDHLAQQIQAAMDDVNKGEQKVTCIVTDNAQVNIAAYKKLLEKPENKDLLYSGCMAHAYNIIFGNVFDDLEADMVRETLKEVLFSVPCLFLLCMRLLAPGKRSWVIHP